MKQIGIIEKLKLLIIASAISIAPVLATGISTPAQAQGPVIHSGFGTATIDGVLFAAEWSPAGSAYFNVNMPAGGTAPGAVHVMNDYDNLYIAISIFTGSVRIPADLGMIYFDNDNDGLLEDGEDAIWIDDDGTFPPPTTPLPPNIQYVDQVWKTTGSCCELLDGCLLDDVTCLSGTTDGSGVRTYGWPNWPTQNPGNNYIVYEFSKPLNSSDDPNDFSLIIGDTVGFNVYIVLPDDGGAGITTSWPAATDPQDVSGYGDIVLAPALDSCAVGGDSDGDGVCDSTPDNCIDTPNGPDQAEVPGVGNQLDSDGDGLGDACDGNDAVNATAVPDVSSGSGIDQCCVSFVPPPNYPIYTINPELFVRIQYKDVLGNWKELNRHRDPAVRIIEINPGPPPTWGGDVITILNSDPICVNIPDADFVELEKLGAVAVRCKFENLVADPDDPNEVPPPNIVPLLRYSAIFSGEVTLNEWVRIDLKPGSLENPINCKSKGKTPLVVYGAEGFDACDLDPSKIFLNGASVALKKDLSYMAHCTDEDEDGRLDLFLHFYTQEIEVYSGNQTVHLTGQTYDGKKSVAAKDTVSPLHCPVE